MNFDTKKLLLVIGLICSFVGCFNGDKVDPEAFQSFTEIVSNRQYPYETHKVTTKQGYILTVFRIQAKNTRIISGKQPIVLWHSITDSSDCFILNQEKSLAFVLANNGYDVWLANGRGNKYSNAHIKYTTKNSQFWDFSWEDQAKDDVPATFVYINKVTQKKIDSIGYSMGATLMFAALAERNPDVLNNLRQYVAIAPLVFMEHISSPALNILKNSQIISIAAKFKSGGVLHAKKGSEIFSVSAMCKHNQVICSYLLQFIEINRPNVENLDRAAVFLGHIPAGASIKTLDHIIQMTKVKGPKMFRYDYGTSKNKQIYGQSTPTEYPLNKITEKIYVFVGAYDTLVPQQDALALCKVLPHAECFSYNYGHLTFHIGQDNSYTQKLLEVLAKNH